MFSHSAFTPQQIQEINRIVANHLYRERVYPNPFTQPHQPFGMSPPPAYPQPRYNDWRGADNKYGETGSIYVVTQPVGKACFKLGSITDDSCVATAIYEGVRDYYDCGIAGPQRLQFHSISTALFDALKLYDVQPNEHYCIEYVTIKDSGEFVSVYLSRIEDSSILEQSVVAIVPDSKQIEIETFGLESMCNTVSNIATLILSSMPDHYHRYVSKDCLKTCVFYTLDAKLRSIAYSGKIYLKQFEVHLNNDGTLDPATVELLEVPDET